MKFIMSFFLQIIFLNELYAVFYNVTIKESWLKHNRDRAEKLKKLTKLKLQLLKGLFGENDRILYNYTAVKINV